jgi:hypothetical protein
MHIKGPAPEHLRRHASRKGADHAETITPARFDRGVGCSARRVRRHGAAGAQSRRPGRRARPRRLCPLCAACPPGRSHPGSGSARTGLDSRALPLGRPGLPVGARLLCQGASCPGPLVPRTLAPQQPRLVLDSGPLALTCMKGAGPRPAPDLPPFFPCSHSPGRLAVNCPAEGDCYSITPSRM